MSRISPSSKKPLPVGSLEVKLPYSGRACFCPCSTRKTGPEGHRCSHRLLPGLPEDFSSAIEKYFST
jgi:hypothetical protein